MPSRALAACAALAAALVPAAMLRGPAAGASPLAAGAPAAAAPAPCGPVPSSTPAAAPTSAPLPPPSPPPTAQPCPVPTATALPTPVLSAAPAPGRPRPTATPHRGLRLDTRTGRARAPVLFPPYRPPVATTRAPAGPGGAVAPLDLSVQPGGREGLAAEPGPRRAGWPVPVAVGLLLLLAAAHLQALVRRL